MEPEPDITEQAKEIVSEYLLLRWGQPVRRPGLKEVIRATDDIRKWGFDRLKRSLPAVVRLTREYFPEGKSYGATEHYLPDVMEAEIKRLKTDQAVTVAAAERKALIADVERGQVVDAAADAIFRGLPPAEQERRLAEAAKEHPHMKGFPTQLRNLVLHKIGQKLREAAMSI